MKTFVMKTMLFTVSLLLGLTSLISSLYARQHVPKVTIRPAGYIFACAYRINLLSHAASPPLDVQFWVGRSAHVVKGCPMHCTMYAGRFDGALQCIIDNQQGVISFEEGKHNKLELTKEHIHSSSVWYTPLNKIIRSMCRCGSSDMSSKSTLRLPHAIPVRHPFRIQSSDECEMSAFYSLDPKSHTPHAYPPIPVWIHIKKEATGKGKKSIIVALATFSPHRNRSGGNPRSVLKYAVTKKGIREITREHINKQHVCWVMPVKKAVEKCVDKYLGLKKVHKKLSKRYGKESK